MLKVSDTTFQIGLLPVSKQDPTKPRQEHAHPNADFRKGRLWWAKVDCRENHLRTRDPDLIRFYLIDEPTVNGPWGVKLRKFVMLDSL